MLQNIEAFQDKSLLMNCLYFLNIIEDIYCIGMIGTYEFFVLFFLQLARNPLFPAAHMGHTDVCQELVKAGVDVNSKDAELRLLLCLNLVIKPSWFKMFFQ